MSFRRIALAATALASASLSVVGLTPAHAVPVWAPIATAKIRPGVQTVTAGGQCTSNFVFYDSSNNVYIGQAAHCSSLGSSTDTNGCTTPSRATGTSVSIGGASYAGTMVYNSWRTMQTKNPPEIDSFTCQYNDFALIKLDSRDYAKVNPSVQYYGGPNGLQTSGSERGDVVYSYGNSSLRFGIAATSPKRGVQFAYGANGWTHGVYTVTPGIPGDSGSGFMDADGMAFGVLSTIATAPLAASNNAGDLAKELAYMAANSSYNVTLAVGTQAFDDPLVP
jgi:hypothetical protein